MAKRQPVNGQPHIVRIPAVLNVPDSFAIVHEVYKDRFLLISCLHLVNTTAAPVTVRVCVVPSGGTPDQTNSLLWDFSIPANDFIEMSDGLLLDRGASLQALCSVAGAVNVFLSGNES